MKNLLECIALLYFPLSLATLLIVAVALLGAIYNVRYLISVRSSW